jgi:hypothetical protein
MDIPLNIVITLHVVLNVVKTTSQTVTPKKKAIQPSAPYVSVIIHPTTKVI